MAVVVEMQNFGTASRAEIAAVVEHVLSDRLRDWRVSIVGSRESDDWDMKIEGPKGFERRYTLIGSAGGQQPDAIRSVLPKLLPT